MVFDHGTIWYDCIIMGQPEAGMGNHSTVITGEKYWSPVLAFPLKFILNAEKSVSILPILPGKPV